jgi:hypothetical protein
VDTKESALSRRPSGTPTTADRYTYVACNPINATDPTGNCRPLTGLTAGFVGFSAAQSFVAGEAFLAAGLLWAGISAAAGLSALVVVLVTVPFVLIPPIRRPRGAHAPVG